jgi:hypothetical protein
MRDAAGSTRAVLSRARSVISVAVKGYGIVIWESAERWRTFTVSANRSVLLAARVEQALATLSIESDDAVRDVLLSIAGARLLTAECGHGPGECEDSVWLN